MNHGQIAGQIEDVADIYEKHGEVEGIWLFSNHGKRLRTMENNELCIEGAIEAVAMIPHAQDEFRSCPLYAAIRGYVSDRETEGVPRELLASSGLFTWNDGWVSARGLGKQYVLDMLHGAAKHERSLA